jgi:hypothetical protein
MEHDSTWHSGHIHIWENRELFMLGGDGFDQGDLSASFYLPSGARLIKAKLYAYDGHSGTDVNVKLEIVREHWPSKSSVSLITLETDTDDTGPGYTTEEGMVGYNVKNEDNWFHSRVTLDNGDRGIVLSLWGVRLYYKLRMSSGPATPTFGDVPLGHLFYDEIESLYASGITLGCGGGDYCPDRPVTRGQMAAFLGRALGLYYDAKDGF